MNRHPHPSGIFDWLPDSLIRLVYAGTRNVPLAERHYHIAANVTGYIATISSASYAALYAIEDFRALDILVYGNLLSAAVTASTPYWHRYGRITVASVLAVTIYSTIFFFTALLGRDSGIQLNYLPVSAIAFLILGLRYKWIAVGFIFLALMLHLLAWFLFPTGTFAGQLPAFFMVQTYVMSALTMTAIVASVLYYVLVLLNQAQARSESLLLNVLPPSIAERLKVDAASSIAERHDNASVVFADLCGFTPLTARLSPEELVELLDRLFTQFDHEAERHGLEKIKTIGDAYMAVSGVPAERSHHAGTVLSFAEAINRITNQLARETGHDLSIRAGIATGPLTAGIIGRAKFAYDVWGETVNRAARLESSGRPGQITIDEPTCLALPGLADVFELGEIELKGIGMVRAWRIGIN